MSVKNCANLDNYSRSLVVEIEDNRNATKEGGKESFFCICLGLEMKKGTFLVSPTVVTSSSKSLSTTVHDIIISTLLNHKSTEP